MRTTGLVMVQLKVMSALDVPSPVVTVIVNGPFSDVPGATIPVMAPVLVLIFRPLGRPEAVNTIVLPEVASVALIGRDTVVPSTVVWSRTAVMVIGLVTVQVNVWLIEYVLSPARRVTV